MVTRWPNECAHRDNPSCGFRVGTGIPDPAHAPDCPQVVLGEDCRGFCPHPDGPRVPQAQPSVDSASLCIPDNGLDAPGEPADPLIE